MLTEARKAVLEKLAISEKQLEALRAIQVAAERADKNERSRWGKAHSGWVAAPEGSRFVRWECCCVEGTWNSGSQTRRTRRPFAGAASGGVTRLLRSLGVAASRGGSRTPVGRF